MLKNSVAGIYEILHPASPLPLILDSPHSGRDYPADFQHSCARDLLERAEDNYVDDLFAGCTALGATLLCAQFPRTYIDVNRAATDIDTDLLADKWHGHIRTTSRSYAGIGLIRRLVKPGMPVYSRKLRAQEIRNRITGYYEPYHSVLAALLDDAHYNFGHVWHINCHSMPAQSCPQADFVLGTRDGTTCDPAFTAALQDSLRGMGYRVALNDPYKGVEILKRHADPRRGRHSLQLEINKGLYWNEDDGKKTSHYKKLKADIQVMITDCASYIQSSLRRDLAAD